jgi:hypothetical protein
MHGGSISSMLVVWMLNFRAPRGFSTIGAQSMSWRHDPNKPGRGRAEARKPMQEAD